MRLHLSFALTFSVALAACAPVAPHTAAPTDSPAAAAGPFFRTKAYPGAVRPQADVATVFATDAGPRYDASFICTVNYRAMERPGCANVVYLSPGSHSLGWQYSGSRHTASGHLAVVLEAGRVYQLNASSLTATGGVVQLIPMAPGTRITYRNVAPNKVPAGTNPDAALPYGVD